MPSTLLFSTLVLCFSSSFAFRIGRGAHCSFLGNYEPHSCFSLRKFQLPVPRFTALSVLRQQDDNHHCLSSKQTLDKNFQRGHGNFKIQKRSTRYPWKISSKTVAVVSSVAASFGAALLVALVCPKVACAASRTGIDFLSVPSLAISSSVAGGGGGNTMAAQTSSWLVSFCQTGFYQAFSLVFLSEIGDKTFFIAGLLAMKTSRFVSFMGSIAALGAMTVVSVLIGQVFHAVPSGFADGIPLDDIAAVLAFAFFGFKTLNEALFETPNGSAMDEELAEAEDVVEGSRTVKATTTWGQLASIFGLVFAAEFGDRSFISTIALSAAQNPISVAGGAIAAHAAATGIAVSGGAVLAKYISERVIGIVSGTLFLVFAVTTALGVF